MGTISQLASFPLTYLRKVMHPPHPPPNFCCNVSSPTAIDTRSLPIAVECNPPTRVFWDPVRQDAAPSAPPKAPQTPTSPLVICLDEISSASDTSSCDSSVSVVIPNSTKRSGHGICVADNATCLRSSSQSQNRDMTARPVRVLRIRFAAVLVRSVLGGLEREPTSATTVHRLSNGLALSLSI